MEVTTRFSEGDEVYYLFDNQAHVDTIKSIEVRTMNGKVYIKYLTNGQFWKNETDLYESMDELKGAL